MRVLFATTLRHLPQAVGGSQRVTDALCNGLAARGIECAVLAAVAATGMIGLRTRALAKIMSWPRVPPDHAPGYPVYRRWSPPEAVADVVARFRPMAAVVTAGSPATLIDALLANGVPTLQYILDALPETLGTAMTPRSGLAFAACSQFLATAVKRRSGIEPVVIPPIVDAGKYRVVTGRRSVVFINPIPEKGVEIALRLAVERPDIPFEFVECWELNAGHERNRQTAKSLPNVIWRKPLLDIRSVYARGRVLLAPSRWDEGWGRVATEAQASGIPVVASRRGGLPEAVGPGGILIDPDNDDVSVWKAALSRLWDDEEAYKHYSAAALSYSLRPEIRPDYLLSKFRDFLSDHYERCAGGSWGMAPASLGHLQANREICSI